MEPTRRKPRMRSADRKRQLLASAKKLFVEHGYQHTTTDRIAREAGVSEPVLYRHFPSKKALFLETLEEVRAATVARWNEATGAIADPGEKLRAVIDHYLSSTREHALEFRIMHRTLVETDDPEIREALAAFYHANEAFLAQTIRDGQKVGRFRADLDPRVGAWELIRTALGYTLTLPLGIPLYAEPDYVPRAVDCLLACLAPR